MNRPTPKYLIIPPVIYMGQGLWDSDGFHIADIRGWGRLSYYENGDKLQDKIGEWLAEAINEKFKNDPI